MSRLSSANVPTLADELAHRSDVRVVLVGQARDRARLRSRVNGSVEIVGEAGTLADARAAAPAAEAYLVAAADAATVSGDDALVEPLTDREAQVLELLAEGLSNKAIGARLGISDQTVKFHVASIAGKLGAHNRTEAVRLAFRRGLLSL
jgi:DNA-binding CsgD family transcriptional regulator